MRSSGIVWFQWTASLTAPIASSYLSSHSSAMLFRNQTSESLGSSLSAWSYDASASSYLLSSTCAFPVSLCAPLSLGSSSTVFLSDCTDSSYSLAWKPASPLIFQRGALDGFTAIPCFA